MSEHREWHMTIPETGFCWCLDCQRTVYNPEPTPLYFERTAAAKIKEITGA